MTTLILASASPGAASSSRCSASHWRSAPRTCPRSGSPARRPRTTRSSLAHDKASAVPGPLVLAADTVVVLDGELLEKPADEDDAVRMLLRLQGRTHQVITAVALRSEVTVFEAVDVTSVTFRPAREGLLRAYARTGEPMDKAGAYGIQGYGAALVEGIEGDFFGVMGLPLRLVLDLLAEAGFPYRFPSP